MILAGFARLWARHARRTAFPAALLLLALLLSGCWSRREINSLAFVLSTGLDVPRSEEESIRLSVAIARPQDFSGSPAQGGGDPPRPWVADTTGHTVFEAVRRMRSTSPRILFWGHNSILVIGEELARQGVSPFLDFFVRDVEPRLTTWVMVAKETTANDILHAGYGVTPAPLNLFENRTGASEWVLIDVNHFMQRLQDEGIEPIATRVERQRLGAENPPGREEPDPGSANEPMGLRMVGAAIFKGDRLVGWFTGREARGYSWVTGENQGGVIIIPTCPDGTEAPTAIELVERPMTRIDVAIEDGRPSVTIHVVHESVIGETACAVDLTSDLIQTFERRLAEAVENEIEEAIARAKLLGSDVFGFGRMFRRKYLRLWNEQLRERWDELFRELDVTVHVTSFIRKSGLTASRFVMN